MDIHKLKPWQGFRRRGRGLGVLICLVVVAGAAPATAQEFTRIGDALAYINQELGQAGCMKPPCWRHSVSVVRTPTGFDIQVDSRAPDGKSHDLYRAPARLLDEKKSRPFAYGSEGEVIVPCVVNGCVTDSDLLTGKYGFAQGGMSFGRFPTRSGGLQKAEGAVRSLIQLAKTTDQRR
jgi:hypothetical protein